MTTEIKQIHVSATRPVWGVLAGLFSLLLAGGGYWLKSVYVAGQATQRAASANQRRLDRLEPRLQAIANGVQRVERQTQHANGELNRKLDKLIERQLDRQ